MGKVSTEKNREYQARYKAKPGIKEKYRQLNKDWIAKNRVRYNEAKAEYRFKLKVAAIEHYSKGSMACAHCSFDADIDALCLDHIENNGAEHRKELGCGGRGSPSGTTIYERLKAIGWMPGLQVLCFNCNTIKELRRKRSGRSSQELLQNIKNPTRWV